MEKGGLWWSAKTQKRPRSKVPPSTPGKLGNAASPNSAEKKSENKTLHTLYITRLIYARVVFRLSYEGKLAY